MAKRPPQHSQTRDRSGLSEDKPSTGAGSWGARSRLRRPLVFLTLAWAATWALGIGVLVTVAIGLSDRLQRRDLEAELTLYATAAYGLAWFDQEGRFHDDFVSLETDFFEGPVDIWIVEPGVVPVFHLEPSRGRVGRKTIADVAQQVVLQATEVHSEVHGAGSHAYRLYAMPTYRGSDNERPHAAIVVVGDPEPGARTHAAFVRQLWLIAGALGAMGLLVGLGLAWLSLRPASAALERGERFLVAAAHELRTPVATLQAVCESGLAGDEPAEAALGRATRLAHRTGEVVDDLLLFARLDAGEATLERQPLRLDLLAELGVPEGADVELDLSETVVDGDPRLLRVAVRNLVGNALQHGAGTGGHGDKPVRLHVAHGRVVVEDSGPGLPATILALARRRFSIAPSTRGAGIGLATCQMIAELHGGSLILENRAQGGTRAVLHLG